MRFGILIELVNLFATLPVTCLRSDSRKNLGQILLEVRKSPYAAESLHHVGQHHYGKEDYKKAAVAYYAAMNAAKESKDYPKATELANKLKAACVDYMKKAAAAQKEYDDNLKKAQDRVKERDLRGEWEKEAARRWLVSTSCVRTCQRTVTGRRPSFGPRTFVEDRFHVSRRQGLKTHDLAA